MLPTVSRGMREAPLANPVIPEGSLGTDAAKDDMPAMERQDKGDEVMVTVNGHPIMRHRIVDILLRTHGPGVLEQLVVLERAQSASAQRGIVVVQRDIDDEYNRMLRQMVDPQPEAPNASFPQQEAEKVLDSVLQQRNISREEFMIGVRRNAYLRKLVISDMHYTDEQLRAEYARAFGRRFLVRHIQLASPAEAARAMDELASGAVFSTVAKRYSANRISAEDGGLLEPFSSDDDVVPLAMRDAVKRLAVGELSKPIRIGRWYQILRLESIIEADSVRFEKVRDQLNRRLKNRDSPDAMRKLYESLLTGAKIDIVNETLRAAWQRKKELANQ